MKIIALVNIVLTVILGICSTAVGIWAAKKSAKVQRELDAMKRAREKKKEEEENTQERVRLREEAAQEELRQGYRSEV